MLSKVTTEYSILFKFEGIKSVWHVALSSSSTVVFLVQTRVHTIAISHTFFGIKSNRRMETVIFAIWRLEESLAQYSVIKKSHTLYSY